MSKKTWILITCLVLSLAMGLGGSLAYLTDRDADVNVFTMGNVDIELTEDFEQGSELMPGLDITKDVKVKNIGKNDAWVWVQIALPAELDNVDASKNVLHFNYSKESVGDGQWKWLESADWNTVPTTTIDNVVYKVYTVLYQTPLAPQTETPYSAMTKVYMDKSIDVAPDGKLYRVVKGEVTEINWNVEDVPYMYVSAYAIQTEGFNTVEEAYNAYNAQWTTEGGENNGLIWAEPGEGEDEPVPVATLAELQQKLNEAAAADGVVNLKLTGEMPADGISITVPENATVVLDLNGKTITAASGNNAIFNNGTLTIKNGTVTGTDQVEAITNKNVMTVDGVTVNTGFDMTAAIGNRGNTKVTPYKYATLTLQGNTVVNGHIYNYFGDIIAGENNTVHNDGGNDNNKYTVTQSVDGNWTVTPIN